MTRDDRTAGFSDQSQGQCWDSEGVFRLPGWQTDHPLLSLSLSLSPSPILSPPSLHRQPLQLGVQAPYILTYLSTCKCLHPPPEGAPGPDTQENLLSQEPPVLGGAPARDGWQLVDKSPRFLVPGVGELRGPPRLSSVALTPSSPQGHSSLWFCL